MVEICALGNTELELASFWTEELSAAWDDVGVGDIEEDITAVEDISVVVESGEAFSRNDEVVYGHLAGSAGLAWSLLELFVVVVSVLLYV